jgi:chromosome segregation ATPase
LAKLRKDEEQYLEHTQVHSELAKDIASREARLVQLEADLAPIRRRIFESRALCDKETDDFGWVADANRELADWTEEKRELTETLRDVKARIAAARAVERPSRSAVGSKTKSVKAVSVVVDPDQVLRSELEALIVSNNRKAAELAKVNQRTQRLVETENAKRKKDVESAEEQRKKFEAQEEELIKNIKKVKIKIAQLRLDRERGVKRD